MLNKKITSILLATSMFAAMSATPVFASNLDTAAGMNAVRYETKDASESGGNDQNSLFDTLVERQEAAEAELEKVRAAADTAADAAEEAADAARNYAEETEGQEIEEAAEAAALHADNAREASDLASTADDSRTLEMTKEIAEAAQAEALEACDDAKEAAEAEAAAKAKEAAEAEAAARERALASAEYLGTFTLTAYCNCAACNGSAGNPTASGVMPTSGHTVAMGGVDFGTKLLINGTVYTVEDRGTPYGHVDIFFDTHEEALDFGMGSADVYLIKE